MARITDFSDYADEAGNRIVGTAASAKNSSIVFGACNCIVEIAPGARFEGAELRMETDGGRFVIGKDSIFRGWARVGLDSSVIIGARVNMVGRGTLSCSERTTVTIGDNCLFAAGITIRSDDAHPIFDLNTGKRLNKSADVTVGEHVWLATDAAILPGAKIGGGCVIGMRSVVTGTIPSDSLAVGVPARVVRTGIGWEKVNVSLKAPYDFQSIDDLTYRDPYTPHFSPRQKFITRLFKAIRKRARRLSPSVVKRAMNS